jgi:hypothetical protein
LIALRTLLPSCRKRPNGRQVSSRSVRGRPRGLGWADLAEGRLCLDHLPATAVHRLSSPAQAHSSRNKKVSGPPSSAALRPQAVRVDRPSAS